MIRRADPEYSSIDLCEQAVHLVRDAPLGTLASYYLGSVPFVVGLVYFIHEMSRSAMASSTIAEWALGMAALYAWMKVWQVVFASGLRSHAAATRDSMRLKQFLSMIPVQAFLHSMSLLIMPLMWLIVIPLFHSWSFFQHVTVFGAAETRMRSLVARSTKHVNTFPAQNVRLYTAFSVMSLIVFINVMILVALLPQMLKMFLGVETAFTRNTYAILNTTTFMLGLSVTYLIVDPVRKAAFVMRSLHFDSLHTGEDLLVELARSKSTTLGAALVCLLMAFSSPALAGRKPVQPDQLRDSISRTLEQQRYQWRSQAAQSETFVLKPIRHFFEAIGKLISQGFDLVKAFLERLDSNPAREVSHGSYFHISFFQLLIVILLCILGAILGVMVYRAFRRRSKDVELAEAVQAIPDIHSEEVTADQLPEDEWLSLARNFVSTGEYRLAVRAMFLAALAALAGRGVITVAKFKSNMEYSAELRRRAHTLPVLIAAFSSIIHVFEPAWYGVHQVTAEDIDRMESDIRLIRDRHA